MAWRLAKFEKKREAAEKEFLAMEFAGIISGSTGSPWAVPLHMVKKPGLNEWRLCGNYCNSNLHTITDSYVIPNLHSLNFQLKGKQVFSRLDLVKGYSGASEQGLSG